MLLIGCFNAFGQRNNFEEAVHVDLHTTNILVGETLHFSAFIYSTASKKTSSLSSVLYLELVDEDGKSVDQTKVAVHNGRAAGTIYISPSLESGTYRLMAYTRWMMNYQGYNEQPILVFNPYRTGDNFESITGTPFVLDTSQLVITESFPPLENVKLNFSTIQPSSLSIAIQKVTNQYYSNELSLKNSSFSLESYEVLPEYRYGFIQGQITKNETPQKNKRVLMTMEGSSIQVSTTISDEFGRFWLQYNPSIVKNEGNLQLLEDEESKIRLINEFYTQYPKLESSGTQLDSLIISELIDRSIARQIQQAYQPLEINQVKSRENFIGFDAQVYYLADYTRFSTMRDTFIEYIPSVGVSKSERDFKMIVRCELTPGQFLADLPPLILLDGIMVSSEDILKLSPNNVERIEVLNKYYYVNDMIFKGVVSVHSLNGKDAQMNPKGMTFQLAEFQNYNPGIQALNSEDDRLPNYESLLFWDPIHSHEGGDLLLNFSTSRLEGIYQVSINGISNNGKSINLNKFIRVQSNNPSTGR